MINREEAINILGKYLSKKSLQEHCLATALVMEKIAEKLGADQEEYYLTGYLHDIDLDLIGDDMSIHAKKGVEILKQYDIPQGVLDAILAHNRHKELETDLEKALWIADPVNGLVIASALMRPDKSISTMNLKSLKKKYKSKKFAAGVSREQIEDCQLLNFSLEEYLQLAMDALAPHERELGLGSGN